MDREPSDPLVAVIIPTFNRAREIRRCLESLLAQTYRDFHVVIVDDGSTDDTETVVHDFKNLLQIRYLKTENTGLPAKARNHGIAQTDSPILAFLDSDDWWHPRKLEFSLKSTPNGDFLIYHDVYRRPLNRIGFCGRRMRSKDISKDPIAFLRTRGNQITNSTVVVNRQLIRQVGGFSESANNRGGEDYELWLRVAASECQFVKVRGSWAYYWDGGGNISSPVGSYIRFSRILKDLEYSSLFVHGWVYFGLGWSSFHLGHRAEAKKYLLKAVTRWRSLRRYRDIFHAIWLLKKSLAA